MSWIHRIAALFRASKLDRELQDELRFHVDSREREFLAQGMSPVQAKREARRAIGGHDRAIEECRDADRIRWIETLWRDLRYSLRTLRASPLFTTTAVVSLALGIGANTAVFTLLHAALWKPLPVRDPQQLVHLLRADPKEASASGGGYSNVLFRQIADAARPFGEVAAKASSGLRKFGMDASSSERVAGEAVSENFFDVVGVAPALGRAFAPGDGAVVVLSHEFWTRRFQSDPSILGKTVYYKETPFTVAGVAQRGFRGVEPEIAIDVWVPIAADVPARWLTSVNNNWLRLIARLRPESRLDEVQGTLDGVFRAAVARDVLPRVTEHFKPMLAAQHLIVKPASAGLATMGRYYERPLLLLLSVAGLVLLICCANVANLMLARNRTRAREIAMRLALGAGRWRIASQLLTESMLLALAGAASGVAIAGPACRLLLGLLPQSSMPLAFDFTPDSTVLGFSASIAVATATLFGLIPALGAADVKSGARVTGRFAAGRVLVAGQLALSLMLLIGAGLFLETLRHFRAVDFGFRTEHLLTFGVSFPRGTPPDRVRQSYTQIRSGLSQTPGIVSASHDTGGGWSTSAEVEGRPPAPGEDNEVGAIAAGPDWFETIKLGLLQGRYLSDRDYAAGAPPVAVINARLARRFFGDASPVGRRMLFRTGQGSPFREIVGVVRDAKHYGLKEKEWPMVFIPSDHDGSFVVRTDDTVGANTVRTVAASAGGVAQIERIGTYQEQIDNSLDRERLLAALCTVFAGLATMLAGIGLYGVLAYGVSRRTAELGIRMALGAQRRDVEWLVLRETAWMVAGGTAAGLAGAFAATRLVKSMLYGVQATDFAVYAAAAVVMAVVAGLAGWLPARRASRVDPMIALRYE